jgi:hypothetical protein
MLSETEKPRSRDRGLLRIGGGDGGGGGGGGGCVPLLPLPPLPPLSLSPSLPPSPLLPLPPPPGKVCACDRGSGNWLGSSPRLIFITYDLAEVLALVTHWRVLSLSLSLSLSLGFHLPGQG